MDAAFGIGNWDTDMIGLIIETINNNADVNTAVEAVDKIITEGIQNVPKLMATYNELGGSPQVQQFLNLFDDNWDLTDLYFEHDNNFANTFNLEDGEATYAITLPFGNEFNSNPNGISIVFNTQNNHPGNILNKSTPFRSSVFFHEIIHAQIILYLASLFNDANVNSENYSPEAWNSFIQAIRNDKLGVFELYSQAYLANPNTSSEQEHEIMANHYFPIMYYVLSQLYPNLTDEEINALIWNGLTGTRAYQQHAENFPGGEMMFHMYLTNTLSIIELNFLIDE